MNLVFVGRAGLYGAAAGGEAGVAHAIGFLRTEVERVMALIGCPAVAALDAGFLAPPETMPASVM